MKNFHILVITGIFLLTSCTNTYYNSDKNLSKLYKNVSSEYELPFVLNFPNCENRPVVRIKLENKNFYMLVDTGTPKNIMFSKGIKKLGVMGKSTTEKINVNDYFFIVDKNDVNLTQSGKKSYLDGILGLEYLSRFETVSFDFKNNKISTEYYPLENEQDFSYMCNHICCEFQINNINYKGLIDTGADCFIYINQIAIDNKLEDNISIYNFNYIKLGLQEYTDITGIYCTNPNINTNEKAKKFIMNNNILGYPFFKDHILRLDFTNKKYEII